MDTQEDSLIMVRTADGMQFMGTYVDTQVGVGVPMDLSNACVVLSDPQYLPGPQGLNLLQPFQLTPLPGTTNLQNLVVLPVWPVLVNNMSPEDRHSMISARKALTAQLQEMSIARRAQQSNLILSSGPRG